MYQAEFLVPVCYCVSRVWNHGTCITTYKALVKNKSIFFNREGVGVLMGQVREVLIQYNATVNTLTHLSDRSDC